MTKHHEEMIEKLEATIKEAQFQIEELKKPKSNYPRIAGFNWRVTQSGKVDTSPIASTDRHAVGNMFETREKAEASNLYKLLNSEYDYWFPGFSEKPDFEPNRLEYWDCDFKTWNSSSITTTNFRSAVYRWKRSEN